MNAFNRCPYGQGASANKYENDQVSALPNGRS
jgi:hypothetical protein